MSAAAAPCEVDGGCVFGHVLGGAAAGLVGVAFAVLWFLLPQPYRRNAER